MSQSGYTLRVWRKPSPSRVERLRRHVDTLDRRYRVGRPVVSDGEFDLLATHLGRLEGGLRPGDLRDRSPLERVGPTIPKLNAEHPSPVYSLDKACSAAELRAWHKAVTNILGHDPVMVLEPKYDGCCVNLVYEDGRFVRAISQGDGRKGMDVTAFARPLRGAAYLRGVKGTVEVRGEVVMSHISWKRFNEHRASIGESMYASPCSTVAASMQITDLGELRRRVLDMQFFAHGFGRADGLARGWRDMIDAYIALNGFGFVTAQGPLLRLRIIERILIGSNGLFWTKDSRWPIDGWVVKVASLDDQAKLGCTHRAQRWAVACKGWR